MIKKLDSTEVYLLERKRRLITKGYDITLEDIPMLDTIAEIEMMRDKNMQGMV